MTAKRISYLLLIIISFLFFVYIAIRAYLVEVTHDEAFSFYLISINYWNALGTTANTHWINSFFMKIPNIFGYNQIWVLRIHNVLSFILYSYFLIKIIRFTENKYSKILFVALFFFNPFCLEYFSLARGYAMSLSFFIGAIYFALKFLSSKVIDYKTFSWSIVLGSISVFASYSALFQFVALFLFLSFHIYKTTNNFQFLRTKKWLLNFGIVLLTGIIAVVNLLLIKFISNDLRYGGDDSFFIDTLDSIVNNILYFDKTPLMYQNQNYFSLPSVIIFLILLISFVYSILKNRTKSLLFNFLFMFSFVIYNITFYLFNTPFPLGRTALILFPSMAFSLIFLIDDISIKSNIKLPINLTILAVMIYVFFSSANFYRSYKWFSQSEVHEILDYVLEKEKGKKPKDIKIISDKMIHGVWRNYYSQVEPEKYNFKYTYYQEELPYSDTIQLKKDIFSQDYIVLTNRYYNSLLETFDGIKLDTVFAKSGVVILKKDKH